MDFKFYTSVSILLVRPLITLVILCSSSFIVMAQEDIYPDSKSFEFKFSPFQATYSQMGQLLKVDMRLSADKKVFNVVMSMPDLTNPSRSITDVIGVSAIDGAFVYRDFHLPLPQWTYNRVEHTDGRLVMESFSADGEKRQQKEINGKLFDGTFAYWQLGSVSPSLNSFTLNRWKTSPNGLVTGASAAFKVEGSRNISVADHSFSCKIFTVEAGPGVKILNYVADEAPYLIKQEYQQGSGPATVVMELAEFQKF